MSKSKGIAIGLVIIIFIISTVLIYQLFFNETYATATITIADELSLDDKKHGEKLHEEKGIAIDHNKKEIAIDQTALHHFIWDVRETESNWLGKYEWISLDDYSIHQAWFTFDEANPVKIYKMTFDESVENDAFHNQSYVVAMTRRDNAFTERTVTAINFVTFHVHDTEANRAHLYVGIDEALTVEYNPKTNNVRLNKADKGLLFSNIKTTFQIEENEVFYGQLFEGYVRNKKGANVEQRAWKQGEYLGNETHQKKKYSSEEEALQVINRSTGPFENYSIVKPDEYVFHDVRFYPETKRANVKVTFDIK